MQEAYSGNKLPNAIGGAVLVGDYLYGSGRNFMCVEFKTGEVKWSEQSVAPASLVYTDDMLYLYGEEGEVALGQATPEAYRERGRFTPPSQLGFWLHRLQQDQNTDHPGTLDELDPVKTDGGQIDIS